jgi:hypothetical protein
LRRKTTTPHSKGFAFLELEAFYFAITFYEFINFYSYKADKQKRYPPIRNRSETIYCPLTVRINVCDELPRGVAVRVTCVAEVGLVTAPALLIMFVIFESHFTL